LFVNNNFADINYGILENIIRYNGVANKRRPRTKIPLKKQTPIIIKNIYLPELLNKATMHENTKANNFTNTEYENGVRLDWLVIPLFIKWKYF